MAATRVDIDMWIKRARQNNYEYILSVCDTFDHEDYPVYCENKKELLRKHEEFDGKDLQRINEIIRIPRKKKAIENLNLNDI